MPTYLAQDGYFPAVDDGWGYWSRAARYVEVPHVMSTECRYDHRTDDPRCSGCKESVSA